jgi:hypothetical protein
MAYIGNTVQNQGFTPAIDYFNGNGVTVTFTLSRPVVSVAQMIVAIDNVIQNPSSAFTVSGNSITFTSAPLSGTNNIWVEYTSLITTYNAISQDPSVIGDITATGGFLAEGDFGNSYIDGTIVDYVTGNARITTGPADGMTFYNGGTSARTALLTLTAVGNVGIGTNSPLSPLQIGTAPETAGTGFVGLTFRSSTNPSAGQGYSVRFDNTQNVANDLGQVSYSFGGGSGSSAGYMFFSTAAAERMRITSAGNVGIGASDPDYRLNVGARSSVNSLAGVGLTLFTSGGLTSSVGGVLNFRPGLGNTVNEIYNLSICAFDHSGDGNADGLSINGSDGVSFSTGGNTRNERMRITSGGSLLVGKTSTGSATQGFEFEGGGNGALLLTRNQAVALLINRLNNDGAVIQFRLNNSDVGSISVSGSNTAYNTSSDYRLKENIAPMTGALDLVQQLKPVTYNWKVDGSSGQGFIAHELQSVVPDCVTGEKDSVDEDGKPVYQGVDTSFLVATLAAAIQELNAKIDAQAAEIAELKAGK